MNDDSRFEIDWLVLRLAQGPGRRSLPAAWRPGRRALFTEHGRPWSKEEMDSVIAHWIALFERQKMGKLRVTRKSDGVLVGRCGFGVYGPETPEIGYSLYPEFWATATPRRRAPCATGISGRRTGRISSALPTYNELAQGSASSAGSTHTRDNDHGHYCEWYIYTGRRRERARRHHTDGSARATRPGGWGAVLQYNGTVRSSKAARRSPPTTAWS